MKENPQYEQTLEYLFRQLPMFQRVGPVAFKKDLTNIWALMEMLGHPQHRFRAIHIAGTNGKGSVAHMLSAVLQANGYKTGLYTSPHYYDFRERIKIDGAWVTKAFIVDFVKEYKERFQKIKPSYFEITVAMAFEYFVRESVDIAVIETGLGGRLDSTNVLEPILSIITNISFDHVNFLGNTLPAIAGEKAGIIKANTPVVIGESHPETAAVFLKKAETTQSLITFADQHYEAKLRSTALEHSCFDVYQDGALHFENLKVNLHGQFQTRNLLTVFSALEQLQNTGFQLNESKVRVGFSELKALSNFIGRWQILAQKPLTIVDSAHNEAGVQLLVTQLNSLSYQQLHFVLGTVNDKDVSKILSLLPAKAIYYFAKANIPRGLDAKQLQTEAATHGLKGEAYDSVKHALNAAQKKADPDDLIFIGGSIFVVGEILGERRI